MTCSLQHEVIGSALLTAATRRVVSFPRRSPGPAEGHEERKRGFRELTFIFCFDKAIQWSLSELFIRQGRLSHKNKPRGEFLACSFKSQKERCKLKKLVFIFFLIFKNMCTLLRLTVICLFSLYGPNLMAREENFKSYYSARGKVIRSISKEDKLIVLENLNSRLRKWHDTQTCRLICSLGWLAFMAYQPF